VTCRGHILDQVLIDQSLPLFGHAHPDVFLLVISAEFQQSKDRQPTPSSPGQPDSKLRGEHLHEETLGINSFCSVNVIFSSICTILKSSGHLSAPDVEAESDEERRGESHAAHEDAGDDVNKRTEEAAVLVLVEKHAVSVDLGGGDDEHDDPNKDGEVAVGLAGPVHHKLAILLSPLACGEQETMALEIVLMH